VGLESHEAHEEIERAHLYNLFQLGSLAFVGAAALGIAFIDHFFPSFFSYPYFGKPFLLTNVYRFWPLFAWAAFASTCLRMLFERSAAAGSDGEIFFRGAITSILAGLWEELGYRFAFIPYAMLFILAVNWFWGFGLGWFLAAVCGIGAIGMLASEGSFLFKAFVALILIALACVFGYWAQASEPVFWLCDRILLPIANLMTGKEMEDILIRGSVNTHLFVLGIFIANTWFRDGHKYQGPIGYVNSWYVGMVLIYATLNYGIVTAIVLHALYDIVCDSTKFITRKLS
jgi:hypothetical protein